MKLDEQNIEKYRSDSEYVKKVLLQIQKDFSHYGDEIHVDSSELTWQKLFDQLQMLLLRWIESDFNQLLTVLYRVDISEKELKKNMLSSEYDSSELIAELIMKRELQKVLLREHFSREFSANQVENRSVSELKKG